MNKASIVNRSIISVSGEDRKKFLQGLITNDINKVSENQAIYSLMLSPQGRFLYDFFIIENDQNLLLDCCSERADEILQKLSFYKLRSKVEIKKEDELLVMVSLREDFDTKIISFTDPRNIAMGFRAFVLKASCDQQQQDHYEYDFHRIKLQLPDDSDLTFDKSFPLEFGCDHLNAVDYKKGCYVGQETTARMHYKSQIRKTIFLVEVPNAEQINKGASIEAGDKKFGEILSSIFYQDQLLALALIKNFDNEGQMIDLQNLALKADGAQIQLLIK